MLVLADFAVESIGGVLTPKPGEIEPGKKIHVVQIVGKPSFCADLANS